MGKKKTTIIGSEQEEALKAKKAVQLEQKKLREGKSVSKSKTESTETSSVENTTPKIELSNDTEFVDIVKRQAEAAKKDAKSLTPESESQPASKKSTHSRSKSYKKAKALINVENTYSLSEGINLLRKVSLTKFDPTVELHVVLKKAPTSKLSVNLPHQFGSAKKVAIATDEVIAAIESGNIDFDVLVATPSQMGKLVKFAKILGPKGLMPNPKNGTVSDKPEDAAKKLAADQSIALKLDKSGPVFHISIGKLSHKDEVLAENIQAVAATTGNNLKKVVLKSTMSPAIKIAVV